MTGIRPAGLLAARRRAEAFERTAEGRLDPSALSPRDAAAIGPMLEVVAGMRAVTPPSPRPEFVADLRERLMTEAETALVPIDTATEERLRLAPAEPAVRRRERRLATVLGGAALLGAVASVEVAAQGALPGEALYPVKRAVEDVRTDATTDDVTRATRLLESATHRLEEIDALARDGSPADVAALPGTIAAFSEQAGEAGELLLDDHRSTGRPSSITPLRHFTGESMTTLTRLEATLPDGAREQLLEAAGTLAALDEQAAATCPSCGGAGIAEIPSVLAAVTSAAVTVPVVLPGTDLPGAEGRTGGVGGDRDGSDRDRPERDRSEGDGSGRDTGPGTGDRTETADPRDPRGPGRDDRTRAPEPPVGPPTVEVPATDVDERTTIGTDVGTTGATATITGPSGSTTDGSTTDTVGGVVDGVVDGVEDLVDGTGGLVESPLGGVGGD